MNKNNLFIILAILITIGLGLLVAFSEGTDKQIVKGTGSLKRDDAYSLGAKGAKVEIVEFSDFQCPSCKGADPGIRKAMNEYSDKVVFYYRHFPLSQHSFARDAAKSAEAAGLQGKFWEMHDLIFENQSSLSATSFETFAAQLGLDLTKYKDDVKSGDIDAKVRTDIKDGEGFGVSSTPTFFINGEKLGESVRTFDEWKVEIEKRLSSN